MASETIAITVDSWAEFADVVGRFGQWAFRGHADARWSLAPTLSRLAEMTRVHLSVLAEQEERVLRIFRRKAHLFLDHIPEETDDFQWLALMQHHGAPTRLMDFTWSPYVAAFFALERPEQEAAVWAVDTIGLWRENRDLLLQTSLKEPGSYREHYLPNSLTFVWQGEPFVMNRRLVAQSGTFLIPSSIREPLDVLLARMDGGPFATKITFANAKAIHREAMRALYGMNITAATLFPDLDGLARSMAFEFEYNWYLDPYSGTRVHGV